VVADLKTMIGELKAAGLGVRPVLIMNDEDAVSVGMLMNPLGQLPFRDDIAAGRLLGFEVISSPNVVKGTAMMVDADALATAFDGPEFMVSEHAALTMANADGSAPTQAAAAAGTIGTPSQVVPDGGIHVAGGAAVGGAAGTGAIAMSLFQTWQTAIRGVWPTSWVMLRPNAVSALNTLSW
jgi:hypothetical protein